MRIDLVQPRRRDRLSTEAEAKKTNTPSASGVVY